MKRKVCGLLLLLSLVSCSKQEPEVEPDYESMVLLDEADEDWMSDEERDRKVVVTDRPDPQELLIVEPAETQ